MVGRRRGNHGVAGPARQFLADVPNHFEAPGHVIEGFADVLADAPQRAAAARAGRAGTMPHLLARQVIGQGAPGRLLRFGRICDDRRRFGGHGRQSFGLVGFQRFDRQLELLARARQLLRGPAKLGAAVARQLEFELGDLGLRRHCIVRHRSDDPLQRGDVVGQVGGCRHEADYRTVTGLGRCSTIG